MDVSTAIDEIKRQWRPMCTIPAMFSAAFRRVCSHHAAFADGSHVLVPDRPTYAVVVVSAEGLGRRMAAFGSSKADASVRNAAVGGEVCVTNRVKLLCPVAIHSSSTSVHVECKHQAFRRSSDYCTSTTARELVGP